MANGSNPLDGQFVQLDLMVDEQTIIDAAVERLRARWTGWEPNDGDPEMVVIEQAGAFAADLAYVVSQMPPAALAAFGQKLYNVNYLPGSPAETTITITVMDNLGYKIPAGVQLEIDGYAFSIFQDTEIVAGTTSLGGVQVFSAVSAKAANGLTGAVTAQLSLPSFVTAVSVDAPTTGGSDPQTFAEYLDMLSSELQLRAKTIVTPRDFEIEALAFNSEIGRVQAIGDTARLVTIALATAPGEVVSTPTKNALVAHYTEFALVNTTFTIINPTYTTVDVTWEAKMVPGFAFDPADLEARINSQITAMLLPSAYGQPVSGDKAAVSNWVPDSKVWKNDIVAVIMGQPGVLHVISVVLHSGAIVLDVDGNLPVPGPAPLTRPGVIDGTVDS